MVHPGSMRVRFLACKFPAGCWSFIAMRSYSGLTLKDRWTRVHCLESLQSQSSQTAELNSEHWHLHTIAPHTADDENYSGPGYEARVWASGAIRVTVLEQLHVESNSECGRYVLYSNSLQLVLASTCQATPTHAEHTTHNADMYSQYNNSTTHLTCLECDCDWC